MKILNIILAIGMSMLLIGILFSNNRGNDDEPVITGSSSTLIESLDESVLKINGDIIYILNGTIKSDILDNIKSEDGTPQLYTITTSEGSSKKYDELYEYDRLYVKAENGVDEEYYTFHFTDSLD